jgi:FSR family fosmidomycin resistance protein-like MFS transporter
MYGLIHAQELLPGRAGMFSIRFIGTASSVADLVAVRLGYLADHASITFVF